MKKFRSGISRDQITLLPKTVEDYVSQEDVVRYVDTFVEELDLSLIEQEYSHTGRPGFSPRVLVKLLIYGKLRNIRSSRSLAIAVKENLKFIFLCCDEKPDFRTISLFRKRFHKELAQILQTTITIGFESGAITLEHVAIDGSLIPAYANNKSYKSAEYLEEYLKKIERSIQEDITLDEQDDGSSDDDSPTPPLPKGLQNKEELRRKVKEAISRHKEETRKSVSITDPDCKLTKIGPAYNGQAAIDENSRMVVGGYATNAACDSGELVDVVQDVERRTNKTPHVVIADGGYKTMQGLVYLAKQGIEGFIPQSRNGGGEYQLKDFIYEEVSDTYTCPGKRKLVSIGSGKRESSQGRQYKAEVSCSDCKLKHKCLRNTTKPLLNEQRSLFISEHHDLVRAMEDNVASARGKQMRHKRSSLIETLFAHLKYIRGFTRFQFRGLQMVNSMWLFELAAYNIEKLFRMESKKQLVN